MAVTRLNTAASSQTNSPSYAISAGTNRCLIVGVTQEVSAPAQLAVAYGGQSMAHIAGIAVGDSTDQRVDLYFLNDAGIQAASGSLVVLTTPPTTFTIHMAAYEYVVQTTPTVTDTYAVTGAGNVTLALTSTTDGCVVCVAGMGNDGTVVWSGGVTEQTEQSGGTTAVGTLADELIGTGGAESYSAAWTPAANRRAGVAANLAFDAGAGITSIDPDEFDMDNGDIDVNSTPGSFDASGNDVYLSPNDLLSEAGEVDISAAINTESTTVINLDLGQLSAGTLASLHSMGPGARFLIVDAAGGEYFIPVTLHRPEAFVMALSTYFTDGAATTSRLTGGSGTFVAGKIHEDQNPFDTVTITSGNKTEMVASMKAKALAREVAYAFRITVSGVLLDSYTDTALVTVSAVSVIARAVGGSFAAVGVLSRSVVSKRGQAGIVGSDGVVTRSATLGRPQLGAFDSNGIVTRKLTLKRSQLGSLSMAGTVVEVVTSVVKEAVAGALSFGGAVYRKLIAKRKTGGQL